MRRAIRRPAGGRAEGVDVDVDGAENTSSSSSCGGGAAVSAQAFDGLDARLSRYSYLVSLLPERIIRDLGLDVRLARRRYSSYTPLPGTDPAAEARHQERVTPGPGSVVDHFAHEGHLQ